MQAVLEEIRCNRSAIIVNHLFKYTYKIIIICSFINFFFNEFVSLYNLVNNLHPADTWLNRNIIKGNMGESLPQFKHELTKKNEHFFGVPAIAKVIVAGIQDKCVGVTHRCNYLVEKPDTG